ncbi:MAG: amidohydrolase family protein [Gammaproteobacteria bacterium]|nr:amidohydrolase family protein [Gammaproteobacteria bacterium]
MLASSHTAGAPEPFPPLVDVHAHLVPLERGRIARLDGVRLIDESRLEIDGEPLALEKLYQPHSLIDWMDEEEIDFALISVPPPVYRQHLDEAANWAWVNYLNDGLGSIAERYPERLRVLAYLPSEHPGLAAEEAQSRRGAPYAGFTLAAGGAGRRVYSDPELTGLWTRLNETGSFVFLHPGACGDVRLRRFYGENLLGNPYESAVAVSHLVFGGVLEAFPEIVFCVAHCGGVVPAVAGRWQRGFDTGRPGLDRNRRPPRELLKRLYVDCIGHHAGLIHLAGQVFGSDRILFGSDWPFPMGLLEPRDQLDDSLRDAMRRNVGRIATVMNRVARAHR